MNASQKDFYTEGNYTPGESVGYLMRGAWQSFLKNIDTEMQTLDLTGMQWGPLLLIAKGCCDTVATCARASYSDSGAMTRMLDRLEAKGLVCRVRNETDRRVVNLALTENGQAVTQQIPAHLVKVLNQHLQGFSDAEFEVFKNLLRRFTDNGNSSMEAL
ncbi:MarR family winged helix-turn-helix transcriptional regulator [Sulfuriferula nivalis]|uniref:MarR family transcriptional regulator n=1 Tax=Sulfuriferula nivalis TaxID=2675298 RepID=A0A809SD92_9PROT|nr:MarR family transcriptional regulator [Sulfuriferula nivalis]BBP00417.1 MarR family transcriptional regulator [Sulfuriferula nivalis]